MKRTFIAMVALLLFAFSGLTTYAQGDAAAAASWIAAQIGADGGFGDGFSEGSSLSATVDAVLAGTAAGQDVSSWGSDRPDRDQRRPSGHGGAAGQDRFGRGRQRAGAP